jgi:hypothetical protein
MGIRIPPATSRNTDGAAYGSSIVTVQRSGIRS